MQTSVSKFLCVVLAVTTFLQITEGFDINNHRITTFGSIVEYNCEMDCGVNAICDKEIGECVCEDSSLYYSCSKQVVQCYIDESIIYHMWSDHIGALYIKITDIENDLKLSFAVTDYNYEETDDIDDPHKVGGIYIKFKDSVPDSPLDTAEFDQLGVLKINESSTFTIPKAIIDKHFNEYLIIELESREFVEFTVEIKTSIVEVPRDSKGLSVGIIIAIVVGSIILLSVIIILLRTFIFKKKRVQRVNRYMIRQNQSIGENEQLNLPVQPNNDHIQNQHPQNDQLQYAPIVPQIPLPNQDLAIGINQQPIEIEFAPPLEPQIPAQNQEQVVPVDPNLQNNPLANALQIVPQAQEQIYLTQKQLDKYFPEVRYQQLKDLYSQPTCSICIEDFEADDICRELYCLHIFHSACIQLWLKKHQDCPNCKKDMTKDEIRKYFRLPRRERVILFKEKVNDIQEKESR